MKKIFLFIILIVFSTIAINAKTIYVNIAATGANDGSSWGDAYTSLQSAIANAAAGDAIWVAEGSYYPEYNPAGTSNEYDKTFLLPNDVEIYGGFPNPEKTGNPSNPNMADRNWETYKTSLLGNIDGGWSYYARHVLLAINVNTVLDGFTVSSGSASATGTTTINSVSVAQNNGGGIYIHNASPKLRNIIFYNNSAYNFGGAAYIASSSSPEFSNVSFESNNVNGTNTGSRSGYGGAVYIASSSPVFEDVTFKYNYVNASSGSYGYGGAVYMVSSTSSYPVFNNVTFESNRAYYYGGAMFIGSSSPVLNNVTFKSNTTSNTSSYGGAVYVSASTPKFDNALFDSNYAALGGGAMYFIQPNTASIKNSIFKSNRITNAGSANNSYGGGAIFIASTGKTTLNMTNTLLHSNYNTNHYGGAILLYSNTSTKSIVNLYNCTLSDNYCFEKSGYGPAIFGRSGIVNMYNTIIYGNGNHTIDLGSTNATEFNRYNSFVRGYNTANLNLDVGNSTGNISADVGVDPLFGLNYSLAHFSPLIDMGDNTKVLAENTTDVLGHPRIWNSVNNTGDSEAKVDLGAYEFYGKNLTDKHIYVNINTTVENGDGSSWASPIKSLDAALSSVGRIATEKIWIAEGTYNPLFKHGFVLPAGGVEIRGGFPNPEKPGNPSNPGLSDRDWNKYPTILEGHVAGSTTNALAKHIMVCLNIANDDKTILDGLILEGASASKLYSDPVSIKINNIDIYNTYGAGLYLHNASPILQNIIVKGNYASEKGNAAYLTEGSNLKMINTLLVSNSYSNTGTLYVESKGNSTFHAINSAIIGPDSNYSIINNSLGLNKIDNSIVWNKIPLLDGSMSGNISSNYIQRKHSMVWGIDDDTNGNIPSCNPRFLASSYRLDPSSPLLDKGDNELYLVLGQGGLEAEKDLENWQRIDTDTYTIDIGPYEGGSCGGENVPYYNNTMFVRLDGNNGTGATWDCAYSSLSEALDRAKVLNDENPGTITQIWVAKGTYYPETFPVGVSSSNPRNKAFVIPLNVTIYGGFADDMIGIDGDTDNRPFKSETILSGDLGYANIATKDDYSDTDVSGFYYKNTEDNAYHVVIATSNEYVYDDKSKLDGFVIEGGRADTFSQMTVNGVDVDNFNGGGIYISNFKLNMSDFSVRYNTAEMYAGKGAGSYVSADADYLIAINYDSSSSNNEYKENKASEGGAIFLENISDLTFSTEIVFSDNIATVRGGALSCSNLNVSIPNAKLYNNIARYEGGAVYFYSKGKSFSSNNSVFEKNVSSMGGAIYSETAYLTISGSFTNNRAEIHGGAVYSKQEGDTGFSLDEACYFTENEATQGNGGAVYLMGESSRYSYGAGTYIGNNALQGSGGGLYAINDNSSSITFSLRKVIVKNNNAKHAGGGLYMDKYSYEFYEGFNISGNKLYGTVKGVGAGIFNYNSHFNINSDNEPSPKFAVISDNESSGEGGGMANYASSYGRLYKTEFTGNLAANYGAAISNSYCDISGDYNEAYLFFDRLKIENNIAAGDVSFDRGGGAIFNGVSSPIFVSSLIANNKISSVGGAGVFNVSAEDSAIAEPTFLNTTIANNSAISKIDYPAGAMYNKGANTKPIIANTIIWGNIGDNANMNIYNADNALPEYSYSLIEGSGGSSSWLAAMGTDNGDNIDADPLFINPNGNFRITDASPAAQMGDETTFTDIVKDSPSYYKDLANNPRATLIYENTYTYIISMGAYEAIACPGPINSTLGIVYVTEKGNGYMDGSSWENAYSGLADPLKYAAEYPGCISEIWVAKGTYYPKYSYNLIAMPSITSGTDEQGYFNIDWDYDEERYYIRRYDIETSEPIDFSTDRDKTFGLVNDVKVYGGFAGVESSIDERTDIHGENETILSGDIDGAKNASLKDDYSIINEDNSYGNTEGNVHHVVLSVGNVSDTSILDGFTIQGGTAFYNEEPYDENGNANAYYSEMSGVLIEGSLPREIIFKNKGGGIFVSEYTTPSLSNLIVTNNTASYSGGGIYNYYTGMLPLPAFVAKDNEDITPVSDSDLQKMPIPEGAVASAENMLKISYIEVSNNRAAYGAGIYSEKKPLFVKHFDIHHNNTFLIDGFDFYGNPSQVGDIGGGLYVIASELYLLNGKVTDNEAGIVGGIWISEEMNRGVIAHSPRDSKGLAVGGDGVPYTLTNLTLSGNIARNEKKGDNSDWMRVGGLLVYGEGSGVYEDDRPSGVRVTPVGEINNSIIWGNLQGADRNISNVAFSKVEGTDGSFSVTTTFKNSLMEESTGSGASWDKMKFGTDGGANIDKDPHFVDYPLIYRLLPTSPAIETGLNSLYTNLGGTITDFDIAGNPRFWNAIDDEEGGTIDMGAYEYPGLKDFCPDPTVDPDVYFDGIFVNELRNGFGESWDCAFHSLYDALYRASQIIAAGGPAPKIYVAKGHYYPEKFRLEDGIIYEDNRNRALVIPDGVEVYGGFADDLTGTYNDISDRPYMAETILSGDLDRDGNLDDILSDGSLINREGNAYHVVVIAGVNTAFIDGFKITGGNADGFGTFEYNGLDVFNYMGGGLYTDKNINLVNEDEDEAGNITEVIKEARVDVNNIIFEENEADRRFGQGGGAFLGYGAVINKNIHFINNKAFQGGGLFNTYGLIANEEDEIGMDEIEFISNKATYGGGLYVGTYIGEEGRFDTDVNYKATRFIQNTADLYGGGFYIAETVERFSIIESLLSENMAAAGGAAYVSPSMFISENTKFIDNTATVYGGGGLYNNGIFDGEDGNSNSANSINLVSVDFSGNNALKGNGGAIYSQVGRIVPMGLNVENNQAINGSGGGIYNFLGSLDVGFGEDLSMVLDSNTAGYEGGGLANVKVFTEIFTNGYPEISYLDFYIRNNIVTHGLGGGIFNFNMNFMSNNWVNNEETGEPIPPYMEIISNRASGEGGGMANYAGTQLSLNNAKIKNNRTDGYGGGISNSYILSEPDDDGDVSKFKNVDISGNIAYNRSLSTEETKTHERGGGGIFNAFSSPVLVNVLLSNNTIANDGGGGLFNLVSKPYLVNVTVAGNIARNTDGTDLKGAGMYNKNESHAKVRNTVIAKNIGADEDIYNFPEDLLSDPINLIYESIPVYGNSLAVGAGIIGLPGDKDIEENYTDVTEPKFRNAATGNFRQDVGSPLIDAGYHDFYSSAPGYFTDIDTDKDIDGNDRLYDDGINEAIIDIGAYEWPTIDRVAVDIMVLLQGPMLPSPATGTDVDLMYNEIQTGTNLFTQPRLPKTNPYGISGVTYEDINDEAGPAGKVVDWVLVDVVRVVANPDNNNLPIIETLQRKALLLKTNSHIVDTNGNVPEFDIQTGTVYLVVYHRNHLSVMSNEITDFTNTVNDPIVYDFTDLLTKAHKYDNLNDPDPMVVHSTGKYCMAAGDIVEEVTDVFGNAEVNSFDVGEVQVDFANAKKDEYLSSDIDMNGESNSIDLGIVILNFEKGIISPLFKYNSNK